MNDVFRRRTIFVFGISQIYFVIVIVIEYVVCAVHANWDLCYSLVHLKGYPAIVAQVTSEI